MSAHRAPTKRKFGCFTPESFAMTERTEAAAAQGPAVA
jgi:hypothetical protein